MENLATNNNFSGRFNPGFNQLTSIQINPFIKYKGLEFFGIYEMANGGEIDNDGSYTQVGAELLYRFGSWEQLYIGGRYNSVSGDNGDSANPQDINRINVGGGWFMTNNVLAKVEYVNQNYSGAGWDSSSFEGGNFSGIMIEAVIGF